MKRPEITDDDREIWKWLDEHVPGWRIGPSERGHAATQESWETYVEEVKAFALSCKDSEEFDKKFLDTVKPLYWPGWKPGKWGGIPSKSR